MSELNEQNNEAPEPPVPEEASWIERLSNAVSDYEVMGAEDTAGLGL